MAVVPTQNFRTIAEPAAPNTFDTVKSTPDDFGALEGKALASLGAQVTKVGDDWTDISNKQDAAAAGVQFDNFQQKMKQSLLEMSDNWDSTKPGFAEAYSQKIADEGNSFLATVPDSVKRDMTLRMQTYAGREATNGAVIARGFAIDTSERAIQAKVNNYATALRGNPTQENYDAIMKDISGDLATSPIPFNKRRDILEQHGQALAQGVAQGLIDKGDDDGARKFILGIATQSSTASGAMGAMPTGTANASRVDAINHSAVGPIADAEAKKAGFDPDLLKTIIHIESGGNPLANTGSYHGLMQLSAKEFAQYSQPGENINDPNANIRAGIASLQDRSAKFQNKYGRPPSATELYLAHQQGDAGLAAHLANPDAPAWQNMNSTGEGKAKGVGWSKLAIWGNIPSDMKKLFPGGVDTVTSAEFAAVWAAKVQGIPYKTALPMAQNGVFGGTPTSAAAVASAGKNAGPQEDQGPTLDANFARNQQFAKAGVQKFQTRLPGDQEKEFQKWVKDNNVPFDPNKIGPQDYDMRGFYAALQAHDPRAETAINENDGKMHFPDTWKTPYHESFSAESIYADANKAPKWNEKDQLVGTDGTVVFDEKKKAAAAKGVQVAQNNQTASDAPPIGIGAGKVVGIKGSAGVNLKNNAAMIQWTETQIKAARVNREAVKKDAEDKILKTLYDADNQNKLTPELVQAARPYITSAHYGNLLKRLNGDDDSKTDNADAVIDLTSNIDKMSTDEFNAKAAQYLKEGKLKTSTYTALSEKNRNANKDDGPASPYKSGMGLVSTTLDPGQLLTGPAASIARAGLGQAKVEFDNWAQQNPRATRAQSITQAQEIISSYQVVNYDKMSLAIGMSPFFPPGVSRQSLKASDLDAAEAAFAAKLPELSPEQQDFYARQLTNWRGILSLQPTTKTPAKAK